MTNKLEITSILLFSIFLFLTVMDVITTNIVLSIGHVEANPILQHFNTHGIQFSDLLFKFSLPVLLGLLVYIGYKISKREKTYILIYTLLGLLIALNVYFTYVVINNFIVLNS